MKKSMCLVAAAVLITVTAVAQNPASSNTNQGSPAMNSKDTMPKGKDTSLNSTNRGKWNDTASNKPRRDTSMANTKWPDTSMAPMSKKVQDTSMNAMNNAMSKNAQDTSMNANGTNPSSSATPSNTPGNLSQVNPNQLSPDTSAKNANQQSSGATSNTATNPGVNKNTNPTTAAASGNTGKDSSASQGMKNTTESMGADRVLMMDDHVMVVRNGVSTALEDSIKLQSGAIVTKDGSVRYSNGTKTKLKKGQYINLNLSKNTTESKQTKGTKAATKQPAKTKE